MLCLITADVRQSLNQLIEYLYRDEQKNWEADGRPKEHIFCDVLRVAYWLNQTGDGV